MASCWAAAMLGNLDGLHLLNTSGAPDEGPSINTKTVSGDRRILMGSGMFPVSTTVQMLQNNTGLQGIARGATKIQHNVVGDADGVLVKNVSGCDIRDLTMTAVAQRGAGNGIHVVGGNPSLQLDTYALRDSGLLIDNVDMDSQFNGILIENDETNDYRNWRTHVRGGRIRNISADGCGIWINTCVGAERFGASQIIERTSIEPSTALALANIRISGTGGCHIIGGYEVFGANPVGTKHAMLIDPPSGGFLTSVIVEGGYLDRSRDSCLRIAPHASVGKFGSVVFMGTWFAGCTLGNVIDIVGASAKLIKFVGGGIYSAESAGKWCAKIDGSTHVEFHGVSIAGAKGGGLWFTGNASNFKVIGCDFTAEGVGTGETTLPAGIQIDAGCDHYTVTGNDLSDPGIGTKITNTPGTSASRRIVQDNVLS